MDAADVRDEAIIEAGVTWDQYSFDEETEFLDWVTLTADRVVADLSEKAGDAWTLEEPNFRDAAVYEVTARLLRKLSNQSNASMTTGEDITVGPITIRSPRASDSVRAQNRIADGYTRRSQVKMMAMGIGRKQGILKRVGRTVTVPYTYEDSHVHYEGP